MSGGERESGKKYLKTFFFPCCTSRGRRRISVIQNSTVSGILSLFFGRKRNEFGD
jgi:hypothetical protein